MKDQETKEKFLELRVKGWSFDRIAQELNTSKQTLIAWSKDLEIEIGNLKAIELEALQEKFYMTKAQRIEVFGEKLKAIKAELDKRDLSKLPTEKVFDLFIKYFNALREEVGELIFRGTEDWASALDLGDKEVTWKP